MGRIKTLMIKNAADELFTSVEGFSEDFERNKKLLKNTMPSKSVRNKVAGGIVRLATKKRLKEHARKSDEKQERSEEDQQIL